jgi:hypothetical protein
MPQIWMTYDEIGAMLGRGPAGARDLVIALGLDRRKSHDGHTRVKLNAALTEIFCDKLVQTWIDRELQACAGDLRAVRERMAVREAGAVQRLAAGR